MLLLATLLLRVEEPLSVALLPLGKVPSTMVRQVEARLEKTYFVDVQVQKAVTPPKSAFNGRRYRADRLLTFLGKMDEFDKVVGITTFDISTTSPPQADWGVFGLGLLGGEPCILSAFRMRKKGAVSLQERMNRVATHELGHTFGLDHCPTPRCVMNDARGKLSTVDKALPTLCRSCKSKTTPRGVAR